MMNDDIQFPPLLSSRARAQWSSARGLPIVYFGSDGVKRIERRGSCSGCAQGGLLGTLLQLRLRAAQEACERRGGGVPDLVCSQTQQHPFEEHERHGRDGIILPQIKVPFVDQFDDCC